MVEKRRRVTFLQVIVLSFSISLKNDNLLAGNVVNQHSEFLDFFYQFYGLVGC